MMKDLLQKDRRGVSIMVGYVLLIIMAVGLSIAVFAYLKLYLPKADAECKDNIIISIDEVSCELSQGTEYYVSLKLTNRGLFNINGAFIRIGEQGRIFKILLNEEENFLFQEGAGSDNLLNPGETWEPENFYLYEPDNPDAPQEIEVEPFVYIDNKPALCEKAIVSKTIFCSG
jgi:hypothetical protein